MAMAGKMDIQLLKTDTMSESEIKEAAERYESIKQERDRYRKFLIDYRDALIKTNVFHIHQASINEFNRVLNIKS